MFAKKVFRSAAAKLIAFAVMMGCLSAAVWTVERGLTELFPQQGEMVYEFEGSFSESHTVNRLMSEVAFDLYNGLTQKLPPEEFRSRFASNFTGQYYGVMDGHVITNLSAAPVEEMVFEQPFYRIDRPGDSSYSGVYWYGSVFPLYEQTDPAPELYWTGEEYAYDPTETLHQYPADSAIFVYFTEEQAAPYLAQWEAGRKIVMDAVTRAVVYGCGALFALVYLLFVTGRHGEDEEVHLVTIDRLFVEGNLVLLFGVPLLMGGVYLNVLIETLNGMEDWNVLFLPLRVLFLASLALALELLLSLVRNVKNHSFVQRSLCLRAAVWCWRTAKRLCAWLLGLLRRARDSVKNRRRGLWQWAFRDYKTRKVVLVFFGYTAVLAFLAFWTGTGEFFPFLLGLAWFVAACWFLIKRLHGFDRVVDALRRLRGGELDTKLTDLPAGVFAAMGEDINSLGDGMQAALQDAIRAERMKSELITNVSHDLKTPLTSILNYSDLLCQEHLTPEEANDYAKIIHQKGLRLKNLTSDLFDISKVQSGAERMDCERLDACTLVRQALGEQDKAVAEAALMLKVTIPEGELPIWADGKKLSRVLENLIGNCVKYAMRGTRVYVTVAQRENTACIELKNIANYEMQFDPREITERFVRGDESRSTEGSGLGLAIAKSYVEACGGTLEVDVDGDLFKVQIVFPLYGV